MNRNPYRHGDIDIDREKIIFLVIIEVPTGQTVVILGNYQFSPMHSFDMEEQNFLC